MKSGIFTVDKMILGGIICLLIVASACYLWYNHSIAPYEKEAAKTAKTASEWKKSQKVNTNNVPEEVTTTPAESTPATVEKPITEFTDQNVLKIPAAIGGDILSVSPNAEPHTIESPFGFGRYPKLPPGWHGFPIWMCEKEFYDSIPSDLARNTELLARVTIKLWNEGDRNWTTANFDAKNGKVYPIYPNTVYVTIVDDVSPDGSVTKRISRQLGRVSAGVDLLNPPDHIRVLDFESSGIDPYEYLDLN